MIKRQIEVVGKTDEQGKFLLYGMNEVNEFFRKNPGCKIVGNFRVFKTGTSEAMLGYYRNYVVPAFREAYYKLGNRMLPDQVDEAIRKLSVTAWGDEGLKTVEEMNCAELVELIDELGQIGAEDFGIIIYDVRV